MNNSIDNMPCCPDPAANVVTIQNVSGLKKYSNCFVRVLDIETTFFVDSKHRVTVVCAGIPEVSNYDVFTNRTNFRNQVVYDRTKKTLTYYGNDGKPTPFAGGVEFNLIDNRPTYAGKVITSSTNIPKVPETIAELSDGDRVDKLENDAINTNAQLGDIQADIQTLESDLAATEQALDQEGIKREAADNNLQSQIDAITSSSDVKDVVGTYADLENYDKSTLGNNDIIKVLNDETHDGAISYYRYDKETGEFKFEGAAGPYYTKSETDTEIQNAISGISLKDSRLTDEGATKANNLEDKQDYGIGVNFSQLGYLTYSEKDLATGEATAKAVNMPVANEENVGLYSPEHYRKVESLEDIYSLNLENLKIEDNRLDLSDAVLEKIAGGGGASEILNEYTQAATAEQVYSAEYINGRLNSNAIVIGAGAYNRHNSSVIIGREAYDNGSSFPSVVIGSFAHSSQGSNANNVAIGHQSIVSSSDATALGATTTASNHNSIALGYRSKTSRDYELSIGDKDNYGSSSSIQRYIANVKAGELDTDAVNLAQVREMITESGGGGSDISIAEEYGDSSTTALSQKFLSNVLNTNSVAIGQNARKESMCIAIGYGANPLTFGMAVGYEAAGLTSFGYRARSTGTNSTALGYNTRAEHAYSVAIGTSSQTSRDGEVSFGYPKSPTELVQTKFLANVKAGELDTDAVNLKQMQDYVAEHGGGAKLYSEYGENEDGALTQKFVSDKLNGQGVVIGNGAITGEEGRRHVVIGQNAQAPSTSNLQVVIGPDAKAGTSGNSVALGYGANASGIGSCALGARAESNSTSSIAIGSSASANTVESVALGESSRTTRAYEVSIGNALVSASYSTRYLTNVRAGERDNDAVNMSQLKAALSRIEELEAKVAELQAN